MAKLPPAGLSESRFGLTYYEPDLHVLCEIIELRRKSGELWGELTVRCNLEGVRGQLDGNRLRQGNFNFSSVATRQAWARALQLMVPEELNQRLDWGNLLERISQSVLDHERIGAIHGSQLQGRRIGPQGRPWAAFPILPHGETSTLFARGGAGKTSLVASMAFGMALGESVIPGIRVDRAYRIAILDWETNQETAEDLWGLLAETHKVPVPDGIWYEPMDSPLERSLPKVASVLDRSKADCVIIDSVGMALLSSGDWSDPSEAITRIYQSLRKLGTWGLLIDHVASNDLRGKRVAMKAYGSIYKLNLARHAVALHIGDRLEETSRAYLACPKSNVARDRWAMAGTVVRTDKELRWSFGEQDFALYDQLMSETQDEPAEEPEERATPRHADLFLQTLATVHPSGMTVTELTAEAGSSSPAFTRKVLNALYRDGLVLPVDQLRSREKSWVITNLGLDFINQAVVVPASPAVEHLEAFPE